MIGSVEIRAGSSESWRIRYYLSNFLFDALILLAAFVLANIIILGNVMGEPGKPHGLVLFGMVAPVYLVLAVQGGAYSPRLVDDVRLAMRHSVWALVQAILLTLLIIYLGKIGSQFSRATFLIGTGLSLLGVIGCRYLISRHGQRLIGGIPVQTIIIRDGEPFQATGHVSIVDAQTEGLDPHRFDAAMAAQFSLLVRGADRVVVACSSDRIGAWDAALQSLSIRGEIVVPEFRRFAPATLGDFQRHPTLIVTGGPLSLGDRIMKRALDIIIASTALILFSPILIAVALVVRFTSSGPILFKQKRLGREARLFGIYKFRTMHNAMADPTASQLTQRNDPRVTRVGAFLRRSSLDELPQLFNVLWGDMSIVGPRPHAPAAKAADSLYWEVDQRYWARHCIKPGMTGLAQVRGHRGPTEEHQDLIDRLQSDLEYVTEWSLWRDVRIIVATLGVLTHDNAV